MTSALREDTNTASLVQRIKDSIIHLCLVNMRRNLEPRALKLSWALNIRTPGKVAAFIHVVSPRQLLQGLLCLERLLQYDFLGSLDLADIRTARLSINRGQRDSPANFKRRRSKVCPAAA